MKQNLDEYLARVLGRWVELVGSHASTVAASTFVLSAALLSYALLNMTIDSDTVRMISADLPERRNQEAFARLFPNLENALLVVIDGKTPEIARDATEELADRLAEQPELFTSVYLPGGGTFFERNGLLYRSLDDLDHFADQMATIQPVIAELEADASIARLARLVRQSLETARHDLEDSEQWATILDRVGQATVGVYDEYPLALSWEEVLLRGTAIESVTRRVIVVHAVLDFDHALAAGDALAGIKATAAALGLTHERGVRVRVTGNPVLNYEEMIGIAWDIGGAGLFCFALVVGVLYLALRSIHLVVASVSTLLVGLVWTAAFAAASIGHLQIVSMSFAVLFIGLGVDFAIHLGMRYASLRQRGTDHPEAMVGAVGSVGSSLVICTLTTAIGFLVFVPTDYRGVAELGLIAGVGMLISLFQTLTLLPALLGSWLRYEPDPARPATLHFELPLWSFIARHAIAVRALALATGVTSLVLIPQARFDANVINMRDPETESVQAFDDLLSEAGTSSPWFLNAVVPDLDAAIELAERLDELDVVDETIHLGDYVPADQQEKLEMLADVSMLIDTPLATPGGTPPSIDEQVDALRQLHDFLDAPWLEEAPSVLGGSMRLLRQQLGDFLARVERDGNPEKALENLEIILLASFPDQVARLRTGIAASAFTIDDLPPELVARMITEDGRARLQIYPRETLRDEASFTLFADEVREVVPDATGIAINLIAFGRATRDSFRQALVSAVLVISLLLLVLWRNLVDSVFVIAPLLLSAVATVGFMVVADMPFNFTNVIAIPLMFGIGVDSGIHLVHRSKLALSEDQDLLSTTTARAVFYSALTTVASFGSLALSGHRGLHTMGILLTVGMLLTVVSNLVVLPALLMLRKRKTLAPAEPTRA